ncbi:phosphopantetheine-binding protein [Micromonospora sp. NPDC000316]|uniref:phosphopantetheine-binding protein n=1 Tax=Micromonospora sp. NPDC000316 TaxID=3364216 RepID=UPI0036A84F62
MTDINQDNSLQPTVEKRVAAIWSDVLRMPPDRPEATFFELQGQSISAVRIITRIEDELGVVVDVGLLFEDPDLAAFTAAVVAASRPAQDAPAANPA